ncbi:MAG: hypothetical protein V9F04_08385 [Dermatophilaceae bacterium]
MAGWLGVVGTALTCLLSLSAIVGATVTLHHEWGAPAAFRIGPLHAREAPIATLLILALAFAGTLGGADIHLARGVTPGGVDAGRGRRRVRRRSPASVRIWLPHSPRGSSKLKSAP